MYRWDVLFFQCDHSSVGHTLEETHRGREAERGEESARVMDSEEQKTSNRSSSSRLIIQVQYAESKSRSRSRSRSWSWSRPADFNLSCVISCYSIFPLPLVFPPSSTYSSCLQATPRRKSQSSEHRNASCPAFSPLLSSLVVISKIFY
jgi:hypothetical protein